MNTTENNKLKTNIYTVWVGGVEVNDYYLTKNEAENLAQEYLNKGYDDVIVDKWYNENKED